MLKPRPEPPKSEAERIKHTALRDRILHDCWEDDARDTLAGTFSEEVRQYLPPPDISNNPGVSLCLQLAVLYEEPPVVGTLDPTPLAPLHLDRLWALMPRLDLWVNWLQEALIRVDPTTGGAPRARLVSPSDILVAVALPESPTRPAYIEELRWRETDAGGAPTGEWTVEAWDVREPTAPRFTLFAYRDGQRIDATAQYVPDLAEDWPAWARKADGSPVLPYVLYHRTVGTGLWDWRTSWGLVIGTLESAARWTSWNALARDCTFGLRYLADGEVMGVGTEAGARVARVSGMSLLQIRSSGQTSARLETLPASASPSEMAIAYESRDASLAEHIGLTAADVHRGSTAQSGYALVVSREGQRRAIRRRIPAAREGDLQMLALWAAVYNRTNGTTYPEDDGDWTIQYQAASLTVEERAARLALMKQEVEMGIRDPADLIMDRNPGMTREDAYEELRKIRRARKMLEEDDSVEASATNGAKDADPMTEEEPADAP